MIKPLLCNKESVSNLAEVSVVKNFLSSVGIIANEYRVLGLRNKYDRIESFTSGLIAISFYMCGNKCLLMKIKNFSDEEKIAFKLPQKMYNYINESTL